MSSRVLLGAVLLLSLCCVGRQSVDVGKKKQGNASISFSDNSGDSQEDAVVITGVQKQSEGLAAEYEFVGRKYGVKGKDWQVVGQSIAKEKSTVFDVIEIEIKADSTRRIYYFDVTQFPWKRK